MIEMNCCRLRFKRLINRLTAGLQVLQKEWVFGYRLHILVDLCHLWDKDEEKKATRILGVDSNGFSLSRKLSPRTRSLSIWIDEMESFSIEAIAVVKRRIGDKQKAF